MAINFLNNPKVGDNVKIEVGNSSDLQIYHDGSNSYIDDSGTGDLYIRANNLRLSNADGSGQFINANNGGAVELYHNNSKKFETTSSGVQVSSNLTFNGSSLISSNTADGSDNAQIIISGGGASGDTRGASVHISGNESGNAGLLQLRAGSGSVSEIRSYTSGSERIRVNSSGNVGIGTTAPSAKLEVSGTVTISHESGSQTSPTTQLLFDNDNIDNGGGYNIDFKTSSNNTANRFMSRIQALRGSGAISSLGFFTETGSALNRALLLDSSQNATFAGQVLCDTNTTAPTGGEAVFYKSSAGAVLSGYQSILETGSAGSRATALTLDNSQNATFSGDVNVQDNLYLQDGSTVRAKIQLNASDRDDLDIITASLGSKMKFFTVGAERMRIDDSGNVGIGMTPDAAVRLSVSGQIGTTNGTAAAPTHTFYGDDDTGMFRAAANNLAFSSGGSERMRIDSAGDVGIGTTDPGVKFQVVGASTTPSNANGGYELMQLIDTASQAANKGGGVGFGGNFNSSNNKTIFSEIRGLKENSTDGNYAGALSFSTRVNGANITERMRINSSGNVGIGTTSPTNKLTISDNSAQILLIDTSTSNKGEIQIGDADFTFNLDRDGAISSGKFAWRIDDTTRMELGLDAADLGQLRLNEYGSGNITGTATQLLGVDENGYIIETSTSGGGTVTGSGTATRVAFWSGTSALSSDANLYWDNSNNRLGIGTNSPTAKLHVNNDNDYAAKFGGTGGGGDYSIEIGQGGTNSSPGFNAVAGSMLFKIADTEAMRINTSRNVGIGISSGMTYPLTIQAGSGNNSYVHFVNSTTGTAYNDGFQVGVADGSSDGYLLLRESANMRFYTGGSERMRITSGGNVGIGTTNPTRLLQLTAGEPILRFNPTTVSGDYLFHAGDGKLYVTPEATGVPTMTFSSGKVGIGATGVFTASHSLNIDGTGLAIKNDTNGSSNNWSTIKNTDTGSNSNLVFNSGLGTALTLNHDKTATFAGAVTFDNVISGVRGSFVSTLTNATVLSAEGNYTSANSVKLFEAKRTGGAVAGNWSYDDATTDMSLGTSTAHSFSIKTGNTRAIIIDSSQKSTFAGDLVIPNAIIHAGDTNTYIQFHNTDEFRVVVAGNERFEVVNSGTTINNALTVNGDALIRDATPVVIIRDSNGTTPSNTIGYISMQESDGTEVAFMGMGSGSNSHLYLAGSAGTDIMLRTDGTTAMFIDTSQRVGIGTTAPDEQLHIKSTSGDVRGLMIEKTVTTSYAELQVKAASEFRLGTAGSDTGIGGQFYIYDATNSAHRFDIDSSGNVGIGTTSPNSFSGQRSLTINGTDNSRIDFQIAGSNKGEVSTSAGALFLIHSTGDVRFQPGGAFQMIVKSGGNVGIGTTAPSQKLTVSDGGAILQEGPTGGGNNTFQTWQYGTDTNYKLLLKQNVGGGIVKHIFDVTNGGTAYANNLVIDRGKIGIGTDSPASLLHLSSASSPTVRIVDTTNSVTLLAFSQDSNAHVGTFSNHDLIFDSNSTERMRIAAGGNVGIGTTNPGHKLSVNGTFKYGSGLEQSGAVSSNEPSNPPDFTPDAYLDITVNGTAYLIPLFERG